MSLGTETFDDIYDGMEEARATLRFGRVTVARALCVEVGAVRQPSEIGGGYDYNIEVRFKAEDEPATKSKIGDYCEVMRYFETEYTRYRIKGRFTPSNLVRLTLEAVSGQ